VIRKEYPKPLDTTEIIQHTRIFYHSFLNLYKYKLLSSVLGIAAFFSCSKKGGGAIIVNKMHLPSIIKQLSKSQKDLSNWRSTLINRVLDQRLRYSELNAIFNRGYDHRLIEINEDLASLSTDKRLDEMVLLKVELRCALRVSVGESD